MCGVIKALALKDVRRIKHLKSNEIENSAQPERSFHFHALISPHFIGRVFHTELFPATEDEPVLHKQARLVQDRKCQQHFSWCR